MLGFLPPVFLFGSFIVFPRGSRLAIGAPKALSNTQATAVIYTGTIISKTHGEIPHLGNETTIGNMTVQCSDWGTHQIR